MRIVIKIGTSTLTYTGGCVNIRRIEALCKIVSDMKNAGHEIILVSSGAIGMGVGKLHLSAKPADIAGKQACAAVGQCELMYTYDKLFGEYNHTVAQILLTAPDLSCEDRLEKFSNTMSWLLGYGVLPIINENDAVATDEIGIETTIGENDTLAAIVARLVSADRLILLSDIDGLYTADPHKDHHARLIPTVTELTDEIYSLAGAAGTSLGSGGMATKLKAASITMEAGIDMVIANGEAPEVLYALFDGKAVGTHFLGKKVLV